MFSLRELRFALCSLDLNFLRAQRIMGFFLNYPQINGVGVSDHVVCKGANKQQQKSSLPQQPVETLPLAPCRHPIRL